MRMICDPELLIIGFMFSTKPTLSQALQVNNFWFISDVKRESEPDASYLEAIDRVLDKGIVIEAWIRMAVGGIDLITVDARVIVASIDTYLKYRPGFDGPAATANRSLIADESSVVTNFGSSRSTPN